MKNNPISAVFLMQTQHDVEGLIGALSSEDAMTRRHAAAALRQLNAWQSVPALQARLNVEQDWQVYAVISAAVDYLDRELHIQRMIREKDVRGFTKMLSSARREEVIVACVALGNIGDRSVVEKLIYVFRNPLVGHQAQLAAAEALLKLESAPAMVTVLAALKRDDVQVRRTAAEMLGAMQATWAIGPLIGLLNDADGLVARSAADALRRIGTTDALQAALNWEETQRKFASAQNLVPRQPTIDLPDALSGASSTTSASTLDSGKPTLG